MRRPNMSAFAPQIVACLPRLQRYARSLLRDQIRAEDLVTQPVMRALEKERLFQPGTNLAGWLLTIMHNEHIGAVRHVAHRLNLAGDDQIANLSRPQTQEAPIELQEVLRAVGRLP